jgi:hypothetical protein
MAFMENEAVAIRSVKDLPDSGKEWLETLLGRLQENQQVFVMAFSPGVEPDAAAKQQGLAAVRQVWDRVGTKMRDQGVAGEDFDAAVDEAMEHVRRRDG